MSITGWEHLLVEACASHELSSRAEEYLSSHRLPLVREHWALRTTDWRLLRTRGAVEGSPEVLASIVVRHPEPAEAEVWAERLPPELRAAALGLRRDAQEPPGELSDRDEVQSWLGRAVEACAVELAGRPALQQHLLACLPVSLLRALAPQLDPPATLDLAGRVNEERALRGVRGSIEGLGVLAALPRGALVRGYTGGSELEQPADLVWWEGCDVLARLDECVEADSLHPLAPLPQGSRLGWSAAILAAARWRRDPATLRMLTAAACVGSGSSGANAGLGLSAAAQVELCAVLEENSSLPPELCCDLEELAASAEQPRLALRRDLGREAVWESAPAACGLEAARVLRESTSVLEEVLSAGAGPCEVFTGLLPSYEGSLRECLESSVLASQSWVSTDPHL